MPHKSCGSLYLEKLCNYLNAMSKKENRRLPDITFVDNALPSVQFFLSDPDKYDTILIQIKGMG